MRVSAVLRLIGATGGAAAVVLRGAPDPLVDPVVAVAILAVSTTLSTGAFTTRLLDRRRVNGVISVLALLDLVNMLTIIVAVDPSVSTGSWTLVLVPVGEAALLSTDRRTTITTAVLSVIGLGASMGVADGWTPDTFGRWALIIFLAGGPVSVFLVQAVAVQQALLRAQAARAKLREQAMHDELTGLLNRRGLADAVAWNVAPEAVLFVDLDGFKAVNDRHGHDAGDEVLRVFGARLSRLVADDGRVARLGGDEFAVVLTSDGSAGDVQDPNLLGDRIERLAEQPVDIRTTFVTVGASVGIATAVDGGASLLGMLDAADTAMYARKVVRRNMRDVRPDPELRAGGTSPAPA